MMNNTLLQIRTQSLNEQPDVLAAIPRLNLATLTHQAAHIPPHVTALLLTSPNGAATVQHSILPAYTVGNSTAQAYPHTVFTGEGDAHALAENLKNQNLSQQHFFHPHGDLANLNWHQTLISQGHKINHQITYTTHFQTTLSEDDIHQLTNATRLVFMSKKLTAHTLNLCQKQGIILAKKTFFALSPNVAEPLKAAFPEASIKIPTKPDATQLKSMLK